VENYGDKSIIGVGFESSEGSDAKPAELRESVCDVGGRTSVQSVAG
jgi:hypothetical protein